MNRHRMLASGYFADVVVGGDPDFKYTVDIDATGVYQMQVHTGDYDCTIDWGDGSPTTTVNETASSNDPAFGLHDYGGAGEFQITIAGLFAGPFTDNQTAQNTRNIKSIDNWGVVPFTQVYRGFYGARLIAINALDGDGKFDSVPHIQQLFRSCTLLSVADFGKFLGSLSLCTSMISAFDNIGLTGKGRSFGTEKVDTRTVTSCRDCFNSADNLDPEIDEWDIRNVTTFQDAFVSTAFSDDSLSAALLSFHAQDLDHGIKSGVSFGAGGATPNTQEAIDAKTYLTDVKGWIFS